MSEGQEDALRPALRETEAELRARLEEACAITEPVSEESTAELIRLEETLSDAARAAKEAVSLRRRLRVDGDATTVTLDAETADEPTTGLREFLDSSGVEWRVWEVIPKASRSATFTADFVAGWLCFETADGTVCRRLPHHPHDWARLDTKGLERLLGQARETRRRLGGEGDESQPS